MTERLTFYEEIRKNKIKSFFLIVIIFVVLLLLGTLIAYASGPDYFLFIIILSIIISLLYVWTSYFYADKIALASVGAREASKTEHRELYDVVESMSLASGLPMPRVYVMDAQQINAFASGRNPRHSVICVTTGTLEKLSKQELEGVIAHEMSHVANYDIRFMTLATVMIGLISIMAEIFLRSLWFGGGRDDRDNKNGFILIIAIVVAILAPILAQLVALAISRKREFAADATGVKLVRSPTGLRNALIKIKKESVGDEKKKFPKAVAPLFISDPFRQRVQNLLSTHPSIDERIKILDRM